MTDKTLAQTHPRFGYRIEKKFKDVLTAQLHATKDLANKKLNGRYRSLTLNDLFIEALVRGVDSIQHDIEDNDILNLKFKTLDFEK